MTPGRTDEELMVEQVERLGARRLAEIVVNHCHRDERLHQTVRIALAASTPGGPLVKTLATEIDAVRASRQFYGYRDSNVLAQELDRIRQAITEYLLPTQPRAAAELLGRLIRLDANVYERSDDSDGVIGDAIGEAVTDCGRAWAAIPERDPKVLAAEVPGRGLLGGATRRRRPCGKSPGSCYPALSSDGRRCSSARSVAAL